MALLSCSYFEMWSRAFQLGDLPLATRTLATVKILMFLWNPQCLIPLNSIITVFCKRKYYLFIPVFLARRGAGLQVGFGGLGSESLA